MIVLAVLIAALAALFVCVSSVRIDLKGLRLPKPRKGAMARQAEAEREKRAKISAAEGEGLAAGELARASGVMMTRPPALELHDQRTERAPRSGGDVVTPPTIAGQETPTVRPGAHR